MSPAVPFLLTQFHGRTLMNEILLFKYSESSSIMISSSEAMNTLLFPVPSLFSAKVAMYPFFNIKDEMSLFKPFGIDSSKYTLLLKMFPNSPLKLFSEKTVKYELLSLWGLIIEPFW